MLCNASPNLNIPGLVFDNDRHVVVDDFGLNVEHVADVFQLRPGVAGFRRFQTSPSVDATGNAFFGAEQEVLADQAGYRLKPTGDGTDLFLVLLKSQRVGLFNFGAVPDNSNEVLSWTL